MDKRNDKIEGSLEVSGDLEFGGLVTGTVRVAAGVTLILSGTATDLIVERGGTAIVHGTVTGTVVNWGGHLEIYGTVGRVTDAAPAAITRAMPGSIINGVRQ